MLCNSGGCLVKLPSAEQLSTRVGTSQSEASRAGKACPYFKLDCNAGINLAKHTAAEQAVLDERSQGQIIATVQSATQKSNAQSNGRSFSVDNSAASIQAAQLPSPSNSQNAHAVQAGNVCPDPLIESRLPNSAQATQAPDFIAQGEGHSVSNSKSAYLDILGPSGFDRLLAIIEAAHAQAWDGAEGENEVIPVECRDLLEDGQRALPGTDHVRPFTLKHARQQAAILGQLQAHGLLQDTRSTSFLELGAGKAYLACMLAEAFPVRSLVLVDNQSFKLQADRTLRKLGVSLERIVSDIKDFEPSGVACLGTGQPWVGMGKHLCGAATDFALLCMARCAAHPSAKSSAQASATNGISGPAGESIAVDMQSQLPRGASDAPHTGSSTDSVLSLQPQGLHDCQRDPEAACGQLRARVEPSGARSGLHGFGIATCCHHRCTWDHYVGHSFFREHGMSEQDFQLVTWMTGWAVCGHGRPPTAKQACTATDTGKSGSNDACIQEVGSDADSCKDALHAAEDQRTAVLAFNPSRALPLERRRSLGAKCKQLIDAGRLHFLRSNGFKGVLATSYVAQGVTGENCMLIGTVNY